MITNNLGQVAGENLLPPTLPTGGESGTGTLRTEQQHKSPI